MPHSWDLPDPGMEPTSLTFPASAGMFSTTSTTWEASTNKLKNVVQSLSHVCFFVTPSMSCSTPRFLVLHYIPEFVQTHVHLVDDAIQTSHPVVTFSSCPQSFQASGAFPVSLLFTSGDQSIGASVSILPMNIQGLLTDLISLQSKGLSRVFSNTTVQKHQFFRALYSNSHIHT